MSILQVSLTRTPALGDIREAKDGDYVYIHPRSAERKDWGRIWSAVGVAFVRGARIVELVEES